MNVERLELNTTSEIRHFRRHQHLARERDAPRAIFRIEEGCACRYRLLSGGRRQITGLFLPGEYCEPQWLLCGKSQSAIVALTALRAREVPLPGRAGQGSGPDAPSESHASELRGMLVAMVRLLEQQTEWIVALGRKSASERICAMLCDMHDRLEASGRTREGTFSLPLTQADMADVAGLTPVHVNRVLRDLRAEGLIDLDGRRLRVLRLDSLRERAAGTGRAAPAPARLDQVHAPA
jgi:CRP-like cAMP-binding protein